ncbi:MAG: hypothetical protein LBP76_00255 [Treponema sp.]|nr:hypothetical protein [Treponema sp.]
MKAKEMAKVMAAMMIAAAVTGCASQAEATMNSSARNAAIEQSKPIRTEPEQRPEWVDTLPNSPTVLSFVGSAGRYATATGNTGARYYAEENGRTQLVDYYGTLMVNQARTHAATYGITSDVLAPQIAGQQLNERIAQNVAQALAPRSYYTLVYLDGTNREAFEVYVLMEVDKALVRRVIDNYGQEQAADYAKKAADEQDAARKQQLEKAAEFFGGNLSSKLGF